MSSPATGVRLSVLDRLLDPSPRDPSARPVTWASSPEAFKQAFLRDVEWLLNTRRVPEPMPELYPELDRSVYHFGIPDVTSLSADSVEARQLLARDIEECLRKFEPRLHSPRVSIAPTEVEGEQRVRFVIDAVLRMDPLTERIVLDTTLDTPTGTFTVSGQTDA